MKIKPYLYSMLTGMLSFGFFLSPFHPISPEITVDPRLRNETLVSELSVDFLSKTKMLMASMGFEYKIPMSPPKIYLGFDQPVTYQNSANIRPINFSLVTLFYRVIPPINSIDDLKDSSNKYTLFTNQELIYDRYHKDFPNLTFEKDTEKIISQLKANQNALALLSDNNISPQLRIIAPPSTLAVWMGWNKSSFKWADLLGMNSELNEILVKMLKKNGGQKKQSEVRIVSVGDIMLARKIGQKIMKEKKISTNAMYPFSETMECLKDADITIGNLECTLSNRGKPMPGKDYTFRARPESVQQLLNAGFDIVTMANNHSKDYGSEAMIDTLNTLKAAGIETIGAGKNESDARNLKILTAKDGTRIGFLGYTMIIPKDFVATSKTPGVIWAYDKYLGRDIREAKSKCDFLIIEYHWGVEYTINPTKEQRELAHRSINLGADMVIGHHPHWIQEVEFYKDKFIAYSLGNFVFDMNHRSKVTEGLLLKFSLRNKKLYQLNLEPVQIKGGEPELIPWGQVSQKSRSRENILTEIFMESGFIN